MPHTVTEFKKLGPPNAMVGPIIDWMIAKDKFGILTLYILVPSPTKINIQEDYMHAPLMWLQLIRGSQIIHEIIRNKQPHRATHDEWKRPTSHIPNHHNNYVSVQAYCSPEHTNTNKRMLQWLEYRQRVCNFHLQHHYVIGSTVLIDQHFGHLIVPITAVDKYQNLWQAIDPEYDYESFGMLTGKPTVPWFKPNSNVLGMETSQAAEHIMHEFQKHANENQTYDFEKISDPDAHKLQLVIGNRMHWQDLSRASRAPNRRCSQ